MGYKKTLLLNLYNLALSDDELHVKEMKYIYDKASEYGVSNTDLDALILDPHKVKFVMPETFDDIFEMSYSFAEIILADGYIDPRELTMFNSMLKRVKYIDIAYGEIIDFLLNSIRLQTPIEECKALFKNLIN
jgi:hypothetical protein